MTSEIEWGEWGELQPNEGRDFQAQCIGGKLEYRYPVKREPAVESASWASFLFGAEYRFTATRIDGVVQPTATVEALK